jgi:hypothetical protein
MPLLQQLVLPFGHVCPIPVCAVRCLCCLRTCLFCSSLCYLWVFPSNSSLCCLWGGRVCPTGTFVASGRNVSVLKQTLLPRYVYFIAAYASMCLFCSSTADYADSGHVRVCPPAAYAASGWICSKAACATLACLFFSSLSSRPMLFYFSQYVFA